MKLCIDGRMIDAKEGSSLRELLVNESMDHHKLSMRPIAAKIAGQVFNLNYIPVREKDLHKEQPSVRAAMAASGGKVQLLRYSDPSGKEVYTRTAQFVMFLAIRRLWPHAKAKMNCTLGPGLYIQVLDCPEFQTQLLKSEMDLLIRQDIPLIRRRMDKADAVARFQERGQEDKAKLLSWRTASYFDVYTCGDFADYYYGELAPSTGYLTGWDLIAYDNGFIFVFPDDIDPDRPAVFRELPNLYSVFSEGERWCRLMHCETVADLNELTLSGKLRELIRVNEALHEKRYAQIADMICQRNARFVMLAGPSSSGKTTSANRLATQLRVQDIKPILMSLDDYYIDRDKCPVDADGKLDLEHINTIDTQLFSAHIADLLDGKTVEIPSFDFKTGKRKWNGHRLILDDDTVVIVEGLHALNPAMIPENFPDHAVFRMYISPLLPLNLDDHNRIPTSYLRLLRRIVRDYETRGSSVQKTLSMWDSVRRGEVRWIFPYQENADVIFNSSTLYELAVLKKHIFPLLLAIGPEESCYDQVRAIVKVLNFVLDADVDDEIPPTSLVREFVGGNTFYK